MRRNCAVGFCSLTSLPCLWATSVSTSHARSISAAVCSRSIAPTAAKYAAMVVSAVIRCATASTLRYPASPIFSAAAVRFSRNIDRSRFSFFSSFPPSHVM